jgi:hypothetical protein
MSDGRMNNGNKGHSTMSNGIDKRKNEYKEVLNDALTEDELISVIRMLYKKSIEKQDTNAAKILIEQYVGKPRQQIDNMNFDGGQVNISPKQWV